MSALVSMSILTLFFVAEAVGLRLEAFAAGQLGTGGAAAAAAGVALLVLDVLLPVPSSIVMTAHGALFGVVVGTLLSTFGGIGAALVGAAIGRAGRPLVARFVSVEERVRSMRLIDRWGAIAIVVTRPVPVLAETTAIVAGAQAMSWGRLTFAAALGVLPTAALYAVAGASASKAGAGTLVFVFVIALSAIVWFIGRRTSAT